ncbi:unnamed protein product [Lactuca saligna]|uniref:Uncharacterized protein n=1 Tax=Lactuca saligna TaxID=75948 RepID=A0AA35YM40_LACSI|nr:unnamed protein product [Lactuca saligna]
MTCPLSFTPTHLPGILTLILMSTILPLQNSLKKKDDVQEPNLSSFQQDPLQDDDIRFYTSSHFKYLQSFQENLECTEENMCILNEKIESRVKTLQVTIEDFEDTTAYIKGQVARNMRRIETLDQKIHNTIETLSDESEDRWIHSVLIQSRLRL